ncbi:MAG: FecR domain-containing protein [Opitutales bacterium]|nr:FecR domain-containing protein [Opitutales bacterium]
MNPYQSDYTDYTLINQEASEWILKTDRGLTAEEQDQFSDWLARSKAHKEAYVKHRWGWEELDRLAGLQTTHDLPVNPDLLIGWEAPHSSKKWLRKWKETSLAVAAIWVLGTFLIYTQFNPSDVEELSKNTPVVVERIRQMDLQDGSSIELNHDAAVLVDYSAEERRVQLLAGEASFDIAKDPKRPFVVDVSGIRFRALGTIFNVRYNQNEVDLIVTEGRVQVMEQEDEYVEETQTPAHEPIVEQSQRAIVTLTENRPNIQVLEIDSHQIIDELIWRPELIDFNQEPLSVIVDEFNRRNKVKMKIDDEQLTSLRLTSIFWSDNVEGFVRLLESNFEVSARWSGENLILLSRNR